MSVVKKSKFLSLILRHKPETIGVELDEAGWVSVEVLLKALKQHGRGMSQGELEEVVANNDKKRFAFSEDGKKIRANQGHSIDIELNYHCTIPPADLFHGTAIKNLDAIYKDGIKKMDRHHVHLSKDVDTAWKVGKRHGKAVVLVIDTVKMFMDKYKFYRSDNGIWLVDHIPPKYIYKAVYEEK